MSPARSLAAFKTMTKIVKIGGNGCSVEELAAIAASILKSGKVIAVPTDTVYGIAALAENTTAVQTVYRIKSRNFKKPLAICVGDVGDIPKFGKITFPKALLSDLFPGPVTMVMERQPCLNPHLNPGVPLIGIRIPNHHFMRTLCCHCEGPLALTSANISSDTSTLSAEEFKELWPSLDLVVDGGTLGHLDPKRLGSTVVDLSVTGCYRIIRPGCSLESTREILQRHSLKELL